MLEKLPKTEIERPRPPSPEKGGLVFPKTPLRFRARSLTWSVRNQFNGGPRHRRKIYQVTLYSGMAAMIDALIVLAINCVFLMALAKWGKIPVKSYQFLVTFAWCAWVYMISFRVFLGGTLGEASCDVKLGLPSEQRHPNYILKVLVRSTLIVMTGIVTLPLLAMIFKKDLAGKISGLRLYSIQSPKT